MCDEEISECGLSKGWMWDGETAMILLNGFVP